MFVSLTRTLKNMSGFRLHFGMRVNKHNCWYILLAMCFYYMFYAGFYILLWSVIGIGWIYYFLGLGCVKFVKAIVSKGKEIYAKYKETEEIK